MLNSSDILKYINFTTLHHTTISTSIFKYNGRDIWYDNGDHKFFEIIKLNNSQNINKQALVIGMNPKKIHGEKLDTTNQLLLDYLKSNGYDSYVLLNCFTKRTYNFDDFCNYCNSLICDPINNFMAIIKSIVSDSNCNEDIFIFWGAQFRDKYINDTDYQDLGNTLKKKKLKYSGDLTMKFVHVSSPDFIDFYDYNLLPQNEKIW